MLLNLAHLREVTWTMQYSVVYVDNPVGTGFSFTDKDECYATSQTDVANDLYSFMVQFYGLFPNLLSVPFYATGESYAGKYVPSIAFKIHQENRGLAGLNSFESRGKVKIPLAGMAIGDGFTDPIQMVPAYAPLLYQIGLMDENQRDHMADMFEHVVQLSKLEKYDEAFTVFDEALNGDLTPYPSFFHNCTGTSNYFNYLLVNEPVEYGYYGKYLGRKEVRRKIHVGEREYHNGTVVEEHMVEDMVKGVSPWVEKLLNAGYKTLFYNGNQDIIVGLPLTERLLWDGLKWDGLDEYRKADRRIWKIGSDVAGYVRKARNLYQVGVRGGGHMIPAEQPVRVLDMLNRFIQGTL